MRSDETISRSPHLGQVQSWIAYSSPKGSSDRSAGVAVAVMVQLVSLNHLLSDDRRLWGRYGRSSSQSAGGALVLRVVRHSLEGICEREKVEFVAVLSGLLYGAPPPPDVEVLNGNRTDFRNRFIFAVATGS